jgi:hypothetical protein
MDALHPGGELIHLITRRQRYLSPAAEDFRRQIAAPSRA